MQRYFLDNSFFGDKEAVLDDDSAHHALRVMRMTSGDQMMVCRMDGCCYSGELKEGNPPAVKLLEKETDARELPVTVTIAQGLPKGDKLEYVLQKATELGAAAVLPFRAERSIAKIDEKKAEKKMVRWEKIVKESAEQAHRQRVPEVFSPHNFENLIKIAENTEHVLIAYEEEAKKGEGAALAGALASVKPGESVMIVVGPEGGLTEREVEILRKAGGISCAFGPRILRTETAPLYVLAVLSYHFELLR